MDPDGSHTCENHFGGSSGDRGQLPPQERRPREQTGLPSWLPISTHLIVTSPWVSAKQYWACRRAYRPLDVLNGQLSLFGLDCARDRQASQETRQQTCLESARMESARMTDRSGLTSFLLDGFPQLFIRPRVSITRPKLVPGTYKASQVSPPNSRRCPV